MILDQIDLDTLQLDAHIRRLWETIKGLQASDAPELENKINDTLAAKSSNAAKSSPQFQFLMIAIRKALANYTSLSLFQHEVESDLAVLFPTTDAQIPEEVEILSFLIHFATYGTVWQITGGLTLIDAYFDLTAKDLQGCDFDKYLKDYPKICPVYVKQKIIEYSQMGLDEFNTEKWRLLNAVLSIAGNNACDYPGVQILDDILISHSDGPLAIAGKRIGFKSYFEKTLKVVPNCIVNLCNHLGGFPIFPNDYHGFIHNLPNNTPTDQLIIHYLTGLEQNIIDKYIENKNKFHASLYNEILVEEQGKGKSVKIISLCQGMDDPIIIDCLAACDAYIFTDTVMEFVQILYPEYGIHGIAHWVTVTNGFSFLMGIVNNPPKDKKASPIDVPKILNAGPDCYPVIYLCSKMGKGTRGISSLSGTLKGAVNAKGDKEIFLKERLINIAGYKAPQIQATITINLMTSQCRQDLLLRRYRFQALNHLMYREVEFLDPIIGDTLCELRPAFLMDCDIIIQNELGNYPNWKILVQGYNHNHQNCPLNESDINHPILLIGHHSDDRAYLALCHNLELALINIGGGYYARFLSLCKAMTRDTMLVRDTLGTEMGEEHTDALQTNESRRRREEMGTYNVWYTKSAFEALQQVTIGGNVTLVDKCKLLLDTIDIMRHCFVLHQDGRIPLVPLYQAQLFTLLKAFVLDRPLIVRLKRIHITQKLNDKELEFNDKKKTVKKLYENYEYQIVKTEVLVYLPNHDTGEFELQTGNVDHLMNIPGVAVSAYGLLDLTDLDNIPNDPGYSQGYVYSSYYEENPDNYFAFIKQQSILNLLNACSANHPPFPGKPLRVLDTSINCESEALISFSNMHSYDDEKSCWRYLNSGRAQNNLISNQFEYLSEAYGVNIGDLQGQCLVSLGGDYSLFGYDAFDDYAQFYRLGEILNLGNRQFKEETLITVNGTVYRRRRGNMPFYSTHIYCSTLGAELRRNQGFFVTGPSDSFISKQGIVDFTLQYLLNELENALSQQ